MKSQESCTQHFSDPSFSKSIIKNGDIILIKTFSILQTLLFAHAFGICEGININNAANFTDKKHFLVGLILGGPREILVVGDLNFWGDL